MSYEELLSDPNWYKARRRILQRDLNLCQNCRNSEIKKKSKIARLISIKKGSRKIEEHYTYNQYNLEIEPVNKFDRLMSKLTLKGLTQEVNSYSDFFNQSDSDFFNSIGRSSIFYLVDSSHGTNEVVRITCVQDGNFENCFLYVRGLEVHHPYYQDQLKPWEYPDEHLITLCWMCHEKLHSNIDHKIPWRDKDGREKGNLTACAKCNGTGFLPEYHYYMQGICFNCQGARYVEFVNKSFKL